MSKLAIFNLPQDAQNADIEDLFSKYGKIAGVSVRNTRGGDTMGFVEFSDKRDAEEAKEKRHGYEYDNRRLRVEYAKGEGKGGDDRWGSRRDSRGRGGSKGWGKGGNSWGRGGWGGGGGWNRGGYKGDSRRRDSRRRRRSGKNEKVKDHYFKVKVIGVPHRTSWQDVKDFLRKGAPVRFTAVEGDIGIGGFDHKEDMEKCIDKCNNTEFKNRDGEIVTVEVVEDFDSNDRNARSPPGSRQQSGRSRSRSRAEDKRSSNKESGGARSRSRSGKRSGSGARSD